MGSLNWAWRICFLVSYSSGRQVGCACWPGGSSGASVGWGPWFLSMWVPPRGYLCFLTAWWMSSERECSKRQEVQLTGQLRATSRTGIVCLHQKQILPLHGVVAWLYCRRPPVMGGIILTIFGKYSLPNAVLLMKLHSHFIQKGRNPLIVNSSQSP